jgi:hypothetical protein
MNMNIAFLSLTIQFVLILYGVSHVNVLLQLTWASPPTRHVGSDGWRPTALAIVLYHWLQIDSYFHLISLLIYHIVMLGSDASR